MREYWIVVGDRVFCNATDLTVAEKTIVDLSKTYRDKLCRVTGHNWKTVKGTQEYINGLEKGQYELTKKILLAIHNQGGTDGSTEYDTAWDSAISVALDTVYVITGVSIEEVLESEEVA